LIIGRQYQPGKDAIIVLWSADPLSIYRVAEKTYVDGVPYWEWIKTLQAKGSKADERV